MTLALLMSVYNGENYLQQQLESLVNQQYHDWKLFIRDDCSTDNTQQIIGEFAEEYPNITVLPGHEKNLGPADSFLHILKEVDAPYYMFCDQDDVWMKDKISVMMNAMQEAEKTYGKIPLMVISDAIVTDEKLNKVSDSFWNLNKFPPELLLQNTAYISIFNAAPGCTMLFNRDLKDVLPLNNSKILMHDWFVMIFALKKGKVIVEPKPLMFYRQHGNNAIGATRVTLLDKLKSVLFTSAERSAREREVYQFVKQFTHISKLQFYILKLQFNIFRYFSGRKTQ